MEMGWTPSTCCRSSKRTGCKKVQHSHQDCFHWLLPCVGQHFLAKKKCIWHSCGGNEGENRACRDAGGTTQEYRVFERVFGENGRRYTYPNSPAAERGDSACARSDCRAVYEVISICFFWPACASIEGRSCCFRCTFRLPLLFFLYLISEAVSHPTLSAVCSRCRR